MPTTEPDRDISFQTVDLPSGRLSFCYVPRARPLVMMLHGNSSCGQAFIHQIDALRGAGFGVLVPDLPGHGLSANAADPAAVYSFPGYARALTGLLDALSIGEIHLLGWSLGGHVALELSARDERVRSVLITGSPPIDPSPKALQAAFRPTPTMALAGKRDFSVEDALAYAKAMLGGRVTPELLRAVRRADGEARFWMIRNGLAGQGVDEAKLVRESLTPLAIVQGARDPFLDMDYLSALSCANLWRGAVQWMDDAGHAPHWEAPEAFNAYLIAFLDDVCGTSRREACASLAASAASPGRP